jgi:hypothetical protein
MNIEGNYKISLRKYLNNYELLNKYKLKNIQDLPKIKKLYIGTKVINFKSEYIVRNTLTYESQFISGLFFFVFFGRMPKIIYRLTGNIEDKRLTDQGEYYINVDVSDIEQISSFFTLATLESENLFCNTSANSHLNKIDKDPSLIKKGIVSYNLTFPANTFFELNEYIRYNTEDVNLSKQSLDISLISHKVPKNVHLANLLKNIFFF